MDPANDTGPVVVPTAQNNQPMTPAMPAAAPTPAVPETGGMNKEVMPPLRPPETAVVVEVGKDHELEPEVEGWIEHLKQDGEIKLTEPIKNDQGEIVMSNVSPQAADDKLVVPLTEEGMKTGLKQPLDSSARWLTEWIKRLIGMFGNKVSYKKGD